MRKIALALVLICAAAAPAAAAACRFTQQDIPDDVGPNRYIDVLDDSHMRLSDPAELCSYFVDDGGGHMQCPQGDEQPFVFAGASPHDHNIRLIIFEGTAWYADRRCKL